MLSPGAESWQERMEQERSQGTQRSLLSAHKGRAMLILFVPLYSDLVGMQLVLVVLLE